MLKKLAHSKACFAIHGRCGDMVAMVKLIDLLACARLANQGSKWVFFVEAGWLF